MAFSQQIKPLSILKILCEALKLLIKNSTLILPILLLSFLSYSLLFISFSLSIHPLITDITSKSIAIASLDPSSPEYASTISAILSDAKQLIAIQSIFIVTSFIVCSLISIATIRALLSNKHSTSFKDLKGPMITQLYLYLFRMGISLLIMSPFAVLMLMLIGRGSMILMASAVALALLGWLWYLCLVMVWSVSLVVSVVEDGCYGLQAISKAGDIVRGRRWQGFTLALIEFVVFGASGAIYGTYYAKFNGSSSMVLQMAIGVVYIGVSVVADVFVWAVSVVFYGDCKRSSGVEEIVVDGGFMYASLPTAAAHDKGAFP